MVKGKNQSCIVSLYVCAHKYSYIDIYVCVCVCCVAYIYIYIPPFIFYTCLFSAIWGRRDLLEPIPAVMGQEAGYISI